MVLLKYDIIGIFEKKLTQFLMCTEIGLLTSIRIARSTTRAVMYPRAKPTTFLATDEDETSTSICKNKLYTH